MKLENNWRQKSISNLEKQAFGNPADESTDMSRRCVELTKVPVGEFSVEDLRLMIGQGLALRYLIPLAIAHLHEDILAEGDLYPGDLLKSVLTVERTFWKENNKLWEEIRPTIKSADLETKDKKLFQLFESLDSEMKKR